VFKGGILPARVVLVYPEVMKSKTGQRQILAILNLSGAALRLPDSLADQLEKAAGTEVAVG